MYENKCSEWMRQRDIETCDFLLKITTYLLRLQLVIYFADF